MDDAEVEAIADRVVKLSPAAKVNFLISMVERLEGQSDRLRRAIEEALDLGETDAMARGKEPYPEWWVVLDRALDPREQ